ESPAGDCRRHPAHAPPWWFPPLTSTRSAESRHDLRAVAGDASVADTVAGLDHPHIAKRDEMIEMGDGLAHGEPDLVSVESRREEDVDQVARRGLAAGVLQDQVEPCRVVNGQFAQAAAHIRERLAM